MTILAFLLQDRPSSFDTMRFPALESQLLDIMKTGGPEHFAEHFKGTLFSHLAFTGFDTRKKYYNSV